MHVQPAGARSGVALPRRNDSAAPLTCQVVGLFVGGGV
jgi:hypothetical protein